MSISLSSPICMLQRSFFYLNILIFSKKVSTGFAFIPHTVTAINPQVQGIATKLRWEGYLDRIQSDNGGVQIRD